MAVSIWKPILCLGLLATGDRGYLADCDGPAFHSRELHGAEGESWTPMFAYNLKLPPTPVSFHLSHHSKPPSWPLFLFSSCLLQVPSLIYHLGKCRGRGARRLAQDHSEAASLGPRGGSL